MTFAELEYNSKKRRTRREIFLEKMEGLIPWQQLEDRIEPFYAKAGRGRRPYPLGVMLRVHRVQLFYNVSDPGMEDLLYEVESVRRFAGLRLSGPLPDETTILNFRHLLETQGLGMGLFEEINVRLASLGHRLKTGTIVDASVIDETTILNFRHLLETQGLGMGLFEEINVRLASLGHRLKTGTIVDASVIDAPSSRRNRRGERDPEMHQTKNGSQWYFGMKAHIGVDAEPGLAHSLATTAANAGDETEAWGDAGYRGVDKRPENAGAARGREPDKSKRLPDGSDRFSGAPASTSSLRWIFEPDLRTATDPGAHVSRGHSSRRYSASVRLRSPHCSTAVTPAFLPRWGLFTPSLELLEESDESTANHHPALRRVGGSSLGLVLQRR